MFCEDNDTLGSIRLEELQQRRISGFEYDNVSSGFDSDKRLIFTISPNDTFVGSWTRKGGLLSAHFVGQQGLYSTRSVDEAYEYTIKMVKQFRRLRIEVSVT